MIRVVRCGERRAAIFYVLVRWPLLIVVGLGLAFSAAFPAIALAKPKVAIAPIDGDDDGKVGALVAEEAGAHATVTSAKHVSKTMSALGIGDTESPRALKKLRIKLDVDAVIHGKVDRDKKTKHLEITVSGRAGKESTFELDFKTVTPKVKKQLRDKLEKHIADAGEGEAAEQDEDDEPKKKTFEDKKSDDDSSRKKSDDDAPRKKSDDDTARKKSDDDRPARKSDDDRPKRVASDDDSTRTRKRSDDDDESTRKRHRRRDDEEAPARNVVTQGALFADAGAFGARRTLTYDGTGMGAPPPVGTAELAAAVEGELYPGAFSTTKASAAIGIYGSFGKAFGLSIPVPGSNASSAIDAGYYSVGLRYRFVFGTSSFAVGAAYWNQHYIADRNLMGAMLDMPDTNYTAVAPGVLAKFAVSPTMGVRLGAEVPLMLSSGQITSTGSFGVAQIIAFSLDGGLDVALGDNYGVHFAGVFEQIGLSFKATSRGVSSATDRTMGVTATFAVIY